MSCGMEETTVLIVGAGPSGLALAVNLGRMNIKVLTSYRHHGAIFRSAADSTKTVILEKELEVTEDPRGIAIAGDAVRVSYQLGIGNALITKIGSGQGVSSRYLANALD